MREARRTPLWRVLANQLRGVIVWILAGAALLSFQFRNWTEGAAIVAVLAINTALGLVTELRAIRSMESLRRMARTTARVRRQGELAEVPAQELVPGDIVLLEGGDLVPADLRLLEASRLACDESMLTGESVPVGKTVEPLPADLPVAERGNMAWKGTAVTRGAGEGVVVATGMATELGRIAKLAAEATEEVTPLERRLGRLSAQLVWVTLGLVAVIAGAGVAAGKDVLLMIETAVALAVAAIPEGLPIVATMALARGMWRMAQRHALIRHLPAVETLGATTAIFTDKTGTLTENRMTVTRALLPDGEVDLGGDGPVDGGAALEEALRAAVLCNNAALPRGPGAPAAVGDPMEQALLVAGARAGLERPVLLARYPEVREEAFDPDMKMMATVHRDGEGLLVAVKGAPEAVVGRATRVGPGDGRPLDDAGRRAWLDRAEGLAADGLRVLALATRRGVPVDAEPYADLVLLGLVGLADPPRRDVGPALGECRRAGIRVVMVTGDHAVTARQIARAVGLLDAGPAAVVEGRALRPPDALPPDERERMLQAPVFARVSPEQKLDLIALHQARGAVVAMTGDGVNDAPALRKADIGIAMGRRGSQVAREAADMVLRDDAFASIVAAIQQGRVIFGNIRKFVLYLLSCNLSEILLVSLAVGSGLPLPLLPLQILYLNLVTDVFPAFALGAGEGEPGVMRRPPRNPREPILAWRHWGAVLAFGALITAATLTAFVLALEVLGLDGRAAVTVSFLTLALAQLWHVLNMRDLGSGLVVNEVTTNPFVWGALALSGTLVLAAVFLPGLSDLLALSAPGPEGWVVVLALSLAPWALGQAAHGVARMVAGGRSGPA